MGNMTKDAQAKDIQAIVAQLADDIIGRWRAEAEVLRRYGHEGSAATVERLAKEVEEQWKSAVAGGAAMKGLGELRDRVEDARAGASVIVRLTEWCRGQDGEGRHVAEGATAEQIATEVLGAGYSRKDLLAVCSGLRVLGWKRFRRPYSRELVWVASEKSVECANG